MKKKYFKNMIAALGIAVLTASYTGIVAEASVSRDTGKYSTMDWFSYNGNGVLDGRDDGIYYSLTAGNVSYSVSATNGNKDYPLYLNLRREKTGFDADYGKKTITSATSYVWNVDATSSKYFLQAYSFNQNRNEYIYGTMHNH